MKPVMVAFFLHMYRIGLLHKAQRAALQAKHDQERSQLASKQFADLSDFLEDLVEKTFPGFYEKKEKPDLKVVS